MSLIGRTIFFTDRMQCCKCEEMDPLELCPNLDKPAACPRVEYEVQIKSVKYEMIKGRLTYTINDAYELSEEQVEKEVTFRPKRNAHGR